MADSPSTAVSKQNESDASEDFDGESTPIDAAARFAELHDESLNLLDAARTLVSEMRSTLDDCRRRRPVVETHHTAGNEPAKSPAVKSHRGGRVRKTHGRRRWRRPR